MGEQLAIPDITPQQSNGGDRGVNLDQVLAQVAAQAQALLPSPYSQGTSISQPRVPQDRQVAPRQPVQPINNTAMASKQANKANGIGAILHLVGAGAAQIQNKKNAQLKDNLKDVMQAKQNVANANTVLQQDPNNAMAKQVLAANKQRLETILTDPKTSKQMQKALDISFVDPEKNKTPEVQAYQAAAKEVKDAGAFNSNNPAEHQVATQAQQGGAPPKPQAAQSQAQGQPPASATPYADRAISKDLPTIEQNPQYAAALKQRQEAQKVMFEKVLPAQLKSHEDQILQGIKSKDAQALENIKTASAYKIAQENNAGRLAIRNAEDKAAMARQISRNSNAVAVANIHAAAIEKIASNTNLSKENIAKVKGQGADAIDRQIKTVTDNMKNYAALANDVQNNKTLTDEQKQDKLKSLSFSRDADMRMLEEYQKIREKNYPDIPVAESAMPAPETTQQSMLGKAFDAMAKLLVPYPNRSDNNGTRSEQSANDNGSVAALKSAEIQLVGESGSDEDNSDEYGHDDSEEEPR